MLRMKNSAIPTARLEPLIFDFAKTDKLDELALKLGRIYQRRTGTECPLPQLREALENWVGRQVAENLENLEKILREMAQAEPGPAGRLPSLIESLADDELPFKCRKLKSEPGKNLNNGFRYYSQRRAAAMIISIVERTGRIDRQKLPRLLFYADFIHFDRYGESISGTTYYYNPFGPAVDELNSILTMLAEHGYLQVLEPRIGRGPLPLIGATFKYSEVFGEALEEIARETIAEVVARIGSMSSEEIDIALETRIKDIFINRFRRSEKRPISYRQAQYLK